ncbi:hypothetical protein UFOVP317_3 [uncultured Caudovirales phage]|uniref:Uncharacterized protein n=1 Tax=uncultured Caudovirales phage TaxID=2100421 RepID=A0A6J5LVG0_9CAUD|nr:hypothetical protein UFOVP317_3 [uncultured Caudovirales phage]
MSDEIPHWAKVRACELANEGREGRSLFRPSDVDNSAPFRAFARYIAQHEPEPVDPDLLLAREAAAQLSDQLGATITAKNMRDGQYDDGHNVRTALIAIKLLRERGQ